MSSHVPMLRAAALHGLRTHAMVLPILVAALVVGVVSALFLSSAPLQQRIALNLGRTDPTLLDGFFRGETAPDGRGLRWTNGDATIELPAQGLGRHILSLTIAAPRPEPADVPLTLSVGGISVSTTLGWREERTYTLLTRELPPLADMHAVDIQSATFVPQEATPRTLGVVVFDVVWRAAVQASWMPAAQAAMIAVITALFVTGLLIARVRLPLIVVLVVMLAAIMLAMRQSDTRFVMRWHALLLNSELATGLTAIVPILRAMRPEPFTTLPIRIWLRRHTLAFAGFVGTTAIFFLWLYGTPGMPLIGNPGDNYEYAWKLGWFLEALTMRTTSPVFSPQIYFPSPTELTNSEMTPAHTLLGLPITWAIGPVAAYNLVVQASFVLTGFCTYLLANRLGAPRAAAWAAGLMFAYTLTRINHAAEGHLGFLGSQWPLLALYGWEGVLRYRRTWDAQIAALGVTLTCWTSWHYGTTLPLVLIVYTLIRCNLREIGALLRRPQPFLIGLLICVPLVAPLAQPYAESLGRGDAVAHPYWELTLHAATPRDYLLPSPYHPLWGAWAQELYGRSGGEFLVAPGISVLVAALAGLWIGRKRRETWALAAIALIALIFSFGPELRLTDGRIIPLPAGWLFETGFPLYGDIRTWGRMAIYVALACALLAGIALAAIPRRQQFVCLLIGACALGELAFAMPSVSAAPRPVDVWLQQQPAAGAIVQYPRGPSGFVMYWTRLTGKPTGQGSGKYAPALYREERDILFSFPDDAMIRLAQRWNIAYIVVSDEELARRAAEQPLLHNVYDDGAYSVFRVVR